MRRPISQQTSFADGFIDASLYELDDELKKVDELLCNEQLLKPYEEVFDPSLGRPGNAVGIYLRMIYLKFRLGLSYEEVEGEGQGKTAVAVFLPPFLDGSSPRRDDLDQAQRKIWRGSDHRPQQGFGQAVGEDPIDQAAADSDRLHHP